MQKNKKIFGNCCYDGKIVKDRLTGVIFCSKCFTEYEIPLFESGNKTSKIING